MIFIAMIALVCAAADDWTVGTVISVEKHAADENDNNAPEQYDITVRVADTDYIVLYSTPQGLHGVEYTPGRDAPVLVGETTLTFRDKVGKTKELPIMSKKAVSKPK